MRTKQEVLNSYDVKEVLQSDYNTLIFITEKEKGVYTYCMYIYTVGIADFILKNMRKRGVTIPPKEWQWRHLEDFKRLKDARAEYYK